MKGSEKSKKSKSSKRVSKLMSDSKSSSSFHSSLNCGSAVRNEARYDLHHFVAQRCLTMHFKHCLSSAIVDFSFKSHRKALDIAILMIFCSHELYRNISEALQGDERFREVKEEQIE